MSSRPSRRLRRAETCLALPTLIESHNGVSIAVLTVQLTTDPNEVFIAKGSARRDPIDRDRPEIGEALAIARALESAANHARRRANGLVTQADHNRLAVHKPLAEWEAEQKAAKKRTRKSKGQRGVKVIDK